MKELGLKEGGVEEEELQRYNVFVLDATREEMAKELDYMLVRVERRRAGGGGAHTDGTDATTHGVDEEAGRANTVDFAMREKEEMRDLTRASEILSIFRDGDGEGGGEAGGVVADGLSGSCTAGRWEPEIGQVFLGNSSDVPLPPDRRFRVRSHVSTQRDANRSEDDDEDDEENAFDWMSNDPRDGFGYDICIECHDFAPFPTAAHLRAAEEHVKMMEKRWVERCLAELGDVDVDSRGGWKEKIPVRPPPSASSVIHLPFPSSPAPSVATLNALMPFIALLERLLQPVHGITVGEAIMQLKPPPPVQLKGRPGMRRASDASSSICPRSLPPPNAFPTSFFVGDKVDSAVSIGRVRSTSATFLPSSMSSTLSSSSSASSVSGSSCSPTSTAPSSAATSPTLLSSPSSIQFFPSCGSNSRNHFNNVNAVPAPLRTRPIKILIYSADGYTESSVLALSILMSLRGFSLPEAYLELQIEKRRSFFVYQSDVAVLRRIESRCERDRERERAMINVGMVPPPPANRKPGRSAALSVSFAPLLRPLRTQSDSDTGTVLAAQSSGRRPRSSTVPTPERPIWGDHQAWFNDPRFDGSFPSRVLPFLYLGNL